MRHRCEEVIASLSGPELAMPFTVQKILLTLRPTLLVGSIEALVNGEGKQSEEFIIVGSTRQSKFIF